MNPKEQLSPEQAIRKCTGDYFGHPVPDSVDDWSPAPAIHTWGDFRDLVATHRADAASQSLRERDEARAAKDGAYAERNRCVVALAKLAGMLGWEYGRALHPAEDTEWEADWRNIVYIDLPTGQVSWHFHDSESALFAAFPEYGKPWDGHTTEEKYQCLSALNCQGLLDGSEALSQSQRSLSETQRLFAEALEEAHRERDEALSELRAAQNVDDPTLLARVLPAVDDLGDVGTTQIHDRLSDTNGLKDTQELVTVSETNGRNTWSGRFMAIELTATGRRMIHFKICASRAIQASPLFSRSRMSLPVLRYEGKSTPSDPRYALTSSRESAGSVDTSKRRRPFGA